MLRTLTAAIFIVTLVAPGDVRELGPVEFKGTWQDGENFSGVARVGERLVVAIDEEGYLQTGLLDQSAWTVTRDKDVVLADGAQSTKIELDIEALAASGATVYALGSHSSTRRTGDRADRPASRNRERLAEGVEQQPLRDVIARFTLDASTGTVTALEKKSLRKAILGHPVLALFAALASKENGIDLEGLAVDGTSLYAGFRGPVLRHGFAAVLQFTFDAPESSTLLLVPLDGRGIRDMAKVDDGLLLLAGPVGDSDTSHRLYLWNGKDCVPGTGGAGGRLRWLADVPAPARAADAERMKAKAEAVLVTAQTATQYELMLLYDGLPNGGATRFSVSRDGTSETPATQLCGRDR